MYVDNKKLYAEMVEYRKNLLENNANKLPRPKISEYIGECIYLIANRLATKPNFAGYTYKDDMIGDGIENCIMYLHNFDPAKSSNPFAYFTQIIYFAFLRRINKEKKQTYIKHKNFEASVLSQMLDSDIEDVAEYQNLLLTTDERINDLINKFESEKTEIKKVKKKIGIENFIGESDE